jgi:hypothetical protein
MEEMRALLLVSPASMVLPGLDRGRQARSETLAVVNERWPEIVRLVESKKVAQGIAAMERLAWEMRERTVRDPQDWWQTLALARRILYDDMLHAAWWAGDLEAAREAFSRCSRWDEELRSYLAEIAAKAT